MSYPIEVRTAPKAGWLTPAESNAYYKLKYDRSTISVHWWGDGTGADNHDNIVNYMNSQAASGNKSTNYVLSDNKITECVNPDMVAFCTGANANAISISIELQPTLGAEGYKKAGWLVAQLEARYGRTLALRGHREFMPTACPGSIDINRIRAEADRWKSGFYNAPAPQPAPQPNPQGAEEMITTREQGLDAYHAIRPFGEPSEAELQATVGKRSFAQFLRDARNEITQRNNALAQQAQAVVQAQQEAQNLRNTITQLQQVNEQDAANKDKQLAELGGKLNDTTSDLQKALLEVQRLNDTVCKVPEKQPDSFTLLERLLSKLFPRPKP